MNEPDDAEQVSPTEMERLRRLLCEDGGSVVEAVQSLCREGLLEWTGGYRDDHPVLVLTRKGRAVAEQVRSEPTAGR